MKRILLVLALVLSAAPAFAQETITPTAPVTAPQTVAYRLHERRFISEPEWTVFVSLVPKPDNSAAQPFWCIYGAQTRTISTPNPPINGVPQPDTVVSTPNVGVQCSNGYSNINAPVGKPDLATIIKALNRGQFGAGNASVDQAICKQLLADGVITGSCTGAPQ